MMNKFRSLLCTSFVAIFAFIAAGQASICCPVICYQPELPKKE